MHSQKSMHCLLAIALLAAGCTTTHTARSKATQLADQISAYRAQQKDRIDSVNQEYHDTFNQLMDAYVDLTKTHLQQQRDVDAQHIADQIISDDKATLIGVMRDAFLQTLKNQRAAISDADVAIATARAAYAKSYSDAKLDLAKLDKVASNLQALSKVGSLPDTFQTGTHVIQVLAQTAQDAQKNARVAAGKSAGKPKTPSIPPAPIPPPKP